MAAILVTLATAKWQLEIAQADTSRDVPIQLKLDQAEGIILDYLGPYADAAWVSPATAPATVSAAIMLMLTHLFEQRGDDPTTDAELWAAIRRVLERIRTPALA